MLLGFFSYEADGHEPSDVGEINQDIKKNLFSEYIWKHDIHEIDKIRKYKMILDSKGDDRKLTSSKSQAIFEIQYGAAPTKKNEEIPHEEENEKEDKNRAKANRKKHNSTEKFNTQFDRVDKIISQSKKDYNVLEKVEEIAKEMKPHRDNDMHKYQELYNELFNVKQVLPALTSRKNQDFVEKISSIQRGLRPEVYKLPAVHEAIGNKAGTKVKTSKVSEI